MNVPERPEAAPVVDELAADNGLGKNRLHARCRQLARVTGIVCVALSLFVLIGGWVFGIASLKTVLPGYSPMMPATAFGVLMCAAALVLHCAERPSLGNRVLLLACSAIPLVIGFLTIIERAFHLTPAIDGVIDAILGAFHVSGRVPVTTAGVMILMSAALLLSRTRRTFAYGQYLAIAGCIMCKFNLLCHAYGVKSVYGVALSLTDGSMAIHSGVAMFALCIGVLLSRPAWGIMVSINSPAPGGVMARTMIPAALMTPVTAGFLRWQVKQLGLNDAAFGLSLFTAINVIIFTILIWRCAKTLNRLDAERAQAEDRMRQLADCMPQMVWTTKANGEADYFNQRCYEYLGEGLEQKREAWWASHIHPDEVSSIKERRSLALANREAYTYEYRFRRDSDGMYRWHLSRGVPVLNAAGELLRWVGTCTDIHNFRQAEFELQNTENEFKQISDSVPHIVWTATPSGDLDYYNQVWHDYTGMTFEQTKDWGWKPVLHPEDLQRTIDRWTEAFTAGAAFQIEYRFRRASDGAFRWHLGRGSPILDGDGKVVRWFGTCTDIEDYKLAEASIRVLNQDLEQRVLELDRMNRQLASANDALQATSIGLKQNNRELQDFASVASHDLQEPLRKVQAFGDRLKTTFSSTMDPQARDYLDRMLNATKRMQSLIQDLLMFSRVASHARPFSPVDLEVVTREVLSDLEIRIAETGAVVEVKDLPTIEADPLQMRQLLQNLVGNALKFHQPGKRPTVRVYSGSIDLTLDGESIFHLVVEDDGIGFEEKYIDRIFTIFQRLHGRTEYEGTGIGLAICRKIAQRHGGDITARSTPGQGAKFIVALPTRRSSLIVPPISFQAADMEIDMEVPQAGAHSIWSAADSNIQ